MSDETLDDLELELRRIPGVRAAGFDERDDLLLVQLHVSSAGRVPGLPVQATRVVARHSDRPVAVELVRWRDAPSAPSSDHEPDTATSSASNVAPAEAEPAPVETDAGPTEVEASATDEIVLDEHEVPAAGAPIANGAPSGRARLLAVLSFPDTDEVEVHLVLDGRRTIGRAPVSGGLPAVVDATVEALVVLGSPVSPQVLWARPLDGGGEGTVLVAAAISCSDTICYGLASGSSPLEAAARAALDALNRRLSAVL
ncbi:MAG: hypothetical protein M5T61_02545 [Acidimicrobiia bacterium]|nr:hypothetical protein [Acidimicrobiia bacterium]